MMIMEEYGLDFTTAELGEAWVKYLPFAFTAEGIALDNLRKGVPAMQAAEVDNPFLNWIGADIRSDPWAYAAPGWPEKAAEIASSRCLRQPPPQRHLRRHVFLRGHISGLRGRQYRGRAAHRPGGDSGGLSAGARGALGAG